jgi:hypothetical protein
MKWILVLIVLTADNEVIKKLEEYPSMLACFEAREQVVESIGKPIVDYQVLCVPKGEKLNK